MKKLLLLIMIVCAGYTVNAQFTAGVHGGLPIGDAGDLATFAIAVDLGYLFEISDTFAAGPTAGIQHNFGESIDTPFGSVDVDDVTYLPIGGAARLDVSDTFTLGADLGYGIGVSPDNIDSGFYYSPRVQYAVSDLIDIVVAYRSTILDGGSWDVISAGVEFGID